MNKKKEDNLSLTEQEKTWLLYLLDFLPKMNEKSSFHEDLRALKDKLEAYVPCD